MALRLLSTDALIIALGGLVKETIHQLDAVIARASERLLSLRKNGTHWDFHAYLGSHFVAQYSLCLRWLAQTDPRLDEMDLKKRLLESQLADGSWQQIKDSGAEGGELNTTVFNYWFLKSIGIATESACLTQARTFILQAGGLEQTSLFTKTFLALFGQYPWQKLTRVPYVLFWEHLPSNYESFSQWVIPHLMPMAYLRSRCVSRDLGRAFNISELNLKKPRGRVHPSRSTTLFDVRLVEKMRLQQQPRGSWGGYTVSTLMTCMVFAHFIEHNPTTRNRYAPALRRGLRFISDLYLDAEDASYNGCLMDGHYWDTLLVGNALLEAGLSTSDLQPTKTYLARTQQHQGGFPYGYDFEYAPDVDDTAEAILFLSRYTDQHENVQSAAAWLLELQNSDGGWGAFSHDNVGNKVLTVLTRGYRDSVDLFDDSSADSTAHVLDALSVAGFNKRNSRVVRKAIRYLKSTQESSGAWIGRWGVNYLFGTSCAVVGLIKAGQPLQSRVIQNALTFLKSSQNADGGFGESVKSYRDPALAGRGPSTPSQTAWVLWALTIAGQENSFEARLAAEYLLRTFNGKWKDEAVTGTGHPGLLYMVYPSYAEAFPLLALATLRNKLSTRKTFIRKTERAHVAHPNSPEIGALNP